MPYKKKRIKRIYWSIGDIAKRFNINPQSIREWEKYYGNLHSYKTEAGRRLFTREDYAVILRLMRYRVKHNCGMYGAIMDYNRQKGIVKS